MEERGKSNKRISKLAMTGTGMTVLLVAIAIAVTFLTVTPVMAQEAEVTVTVNAPEYVGEGETFDVTIGVEGITDFYGGSFDLSFDHRVVKVKKVTDGSIDDTKIPVAMWDDMDSDTIKVILELSGYTTVSGSGYLAKISFKVKGKEGEESALELSDGELAKYVFEDDRATPEAIGANWNDAKITVGAKEEEKEEEEEPPGITAWEPAEAVVSSTEGESMTFEITTDQKVDISWQMNGTEVQTDGDITGAIYTNTNAVAGIWNVSAIAISTETGLSTMRTWIWSVASASTEALGVTPTSTPTLAPGETPKPATTLAPGETPKPTATPAIKPTPKPTAPPTTEGKPTPTPTPKPAVPGFEAVVAIAVMSAIAYVLRRKKEGRSK